MKLKDDRLKCQPTVASRRFYVSCAVVHNLRTVPNISNNNYNELFFLQRTFFFMQETINGISVLSRNQFF